VVTGATGGVGALYAVGLAERGYDLVLVGRQQKTLDAVVNAVRQKADVKVDTIVANLAESKDLARRGADIKRSRDHHVDQYAGIASFSRSPSRVSKRWMRRPQSTSPP